MSRDDEQIRRRYAGREIDPIEAFTIHLALQELCDSADAYLEVEIDPDDTADRVEANCRAVAAEMDMELLIAVIETRHVPDAHGRITSEPAVFHITLAPER